MKPQFATTLALALGLSIVSVASTAAQTIYGLQRASQLSSNSSGDFYIQIGSFKSKANALRVKSSLQGKTREPVSIRQKHSYYIVTMGPIHSAAAVRERVRQISSKTKPQVTGIVQAKAKTKTIYKNNVEVYKDKDGFPLSSTNRWFVGLGVGWMFPFSIQSSSFATSGMPGFPDDRYHADHSDSAGQYSGFAGYQWRSASETWLPAYSLSLQYTYTNSIKIDGFIYVNDLPEAKNFNYQYKISQHLPLAKLKLDLYRWQQFMPFVSAGAGVALNRVYDYVEGPIPGATLMQRRDSFSSHNKTQFAGSLGAGFDFDLNDKAQLSLGYELSYYGKAQTGSGQNVLSGYHLNNKLNSNAVVLQGLYFFDW